MKWKKISLEMRIERDVGEKWKQWLDEGLALQKTRNA